MMEVLKGVRQKICYYNGPLESPKSIQIREAIGSMPLQRFKIMIWFAFALSGLHSPCDCNPSLVFGVSNSRGNSIPSIESSVDTVALVVGVKVGCRQTSRGKGKVLHVGLNGTIDNRVDATIPFRA